MTKNRKIDRKISTTSKPELGRKKTWAFRIIALVAMPILLFGGLEAGLRVVGLGYPTKAVIEKDFDGKPWCFRNAQFAWRFFPHQMARDFDDGLTFEKKKAPGTFRIFVLGGSAARGTPENMFSFGRILEAMLGEMYPDIHFEIYNAAMTAINSHVVLEIAKDCAEYEPDLFILYLGNNEVVGPYGPGTVFSSSLASLPIIRANIAVKSTRIGQLFDDLMGMASSSGEASQQWEGMAMFLDKQVRPDSGALGSVYQNFERNLQDICRVARRSDADVIVSNVGANIQDCPPFASLHRQGLSQSLKKQWEGIYQEGVDFEAKELYEQAIERFLEAAAIDDTFANLQFRLARSYWEIGDFENARLHYQLALQNDTLRFRADTQINDIIRKTAEGRSNEGIYFADSVAAFEASGPHGIPGAELFYEHVHLKFKGNYILARTMIPIVQQLLPSTAGTHGEMLSEEQVARRIAYTAFDEYMDLQTMYQDYLNKPPFTNQLYHDDSMKKLEDDVERLRNGVDLQKCSETYNQAIRENPEDWRLLIKQYQLMYAMQGERALSQMEIKLRQVVALHPIEQAYRLLGDMLLWQGRLDEAEDVLNKSLYMNPASGEARFSLAKLSLKRGHRTSAIQHLRKGIKVAPADAIAPYGLLANLYEDTDEPGKAVKVLRKAVATFPENQTAQVHFDLAKLLYGQGKRDKALEHMETAMRLNPDFAKLEEFMIQYHLIKGQ